MAEILPFPGFPFEDEPQLPDAQARREMSNRARAMARPDAAKVIVDKVLELARLRQGYGGQAAD